jgi:hypothetical protein
MTNNPLTHTLSPMGRGEKRLGRRQKKRQVKKGNIDNYFGA